MKPHTAATITPTTIGPVCPGWMPALTAAGNSIMNEPSIDGIEIKKANFTAYDLSIPVTSPPNNVEPDLDIPGVIAIPCIMPINIAYLNLVCGINLLSDPYRSAIQRSIPVIINPVPITVKER